MGSVGNRVEGISSILSYRAPSLSHSLSPTRSLPLALSLSLIIPDALVV